MEGSSDNSDETDKTSDENVEKSDTENPMHQGENTGVYGKETKASKYVAKKAVAIAMVAREITK